MEGRGRSRARRKRKLFSSKRLTSFLLAAAMIGTNVGADLNTAYAAGFSSEVAFEMRGSDLVTAIEDAIATENTVTPDDLDFTNGKVEQFEGYLFGEGKLYEAYPEVEGGDVSADLRVFVRLPEDGDDMYAVTGDEEVIFLYVNNSSDTVKFRSCINYMVDGEEKVKKTDWVTVRSYESAYGDEEVNVISDPVEPPVTEAPEETEGPANDTETTAPDGETTAPETPETDAPAGETPDSGEGGETDVPETDVPENDPLATDSELTLSMSQNVVSLVAMPGDELATPSDMTDGSEDEEETTAPEETTGSEEETTAAEETTGSEEETTAAEETTTAPAEEETTATGETAVSEDPKATESETEKPEVPNAPKPTYSDLVGVGWSGTAKLYSTTLKKLHALDDVEGWPVNYSIAPAGSARIIDGPRGVEDGEDLYFGVKNQIGYAVETVLANGEELTADTITDNSDGSQTVWYNVPEVMGEQDVDVVMTETGEHPAFEQVLTMDDGMEITIRAGEGVLPAGVQAAASVVTGIEDVVKENVEAEAAAAGEEKEVITSLSYNIDLLDADGNKLDDQIWNGVVEVTFSGAPMEEHSKDADSVEVVYVETTKESEPQAEIQAEDVVSVETVSQTVDVAEGDSVTEVSFEAEHFSVYTVTFYSGYKSTDLKVYVMDAGTKEELQNRTVSLPGGTYSDGDVIQIANLAEMIRTNMGLSADEYPFLSATTGNNLTGNAVNVLYVHKENYYGDLRLYRSREYHWMGNYYSYSDPVNTLYFWYGEPSVTITFNRNNGSGTAPGAVIAKAGEFIELPDQGNMTPPYNCVFSGWSRITNPNEDGKYKPGNNGTVYPAGYQFEVPENDITLYAVWSQKNVDAEFYIRLDGQIPTEPQGHDASQYTSAIAVDGAIKVATFYTNSTYPGVRPMLNSVPTDEQIQSVCRAKGVSYNPNTHYVLWYVIKSESTWHVDGVVLERDKVNLSYNANGKTFVDGTMPDGQQYAPNSTAIISSRVPQNQEGYHFVEWNTEADGTGTAYDPNDSFTITEDTTLYAQWAANTNTQYTVEFYYQSNGRYGTTTDIRKTYTGTTGATAVVSEADKIPTEPGYVFDANASNVLQDTISGDGSLVLKVYFKQQFDVTISGDSHVVNPTVTDAVVDWNGSSTGRWSVETGYEVEQVTVNGTETTVSGNSVDVTSIQEDTVIYVTTKARQDTAYKVEYYYQNETTGVFEKDTALTATRNNGTTGQTVSVTETDKTVADEKDSHYVLDESQNTAWTQTVNADGSTVLKVYFKLQYTVTYTAEDNGTITGTTSQTVDWGGSTSQVTAVGNLGYHFTKWSDDETTAARTDTGVKSDAEYTAKFEANTNTAYTVEYYYQNETTGVFEKDTALTATRNNGTTGQTVSVTETDKTVADGKDSHYVLDESQNTAWTQTVNADGSTVLKVYFKLQYTVTYKAEVNGSISGTASQTVDWGGSTSQVTAVANLGYHFTKWSDDKATAARTDTGVKSDAEYTAKFQANTNTAYTVEFYYQNESTGKFEKDATLTATRNNGTTDQAISITDVDKNVADGKDSHYVLDANRNSAWTQIVRADGSTILKVYFKLQYTVTYKAEVNGSISGVTSQRVDWGGSTSQVTAVADQGYHFTKWDDETTTTAARTDADVKSDATYTAQFEADTDTQYTVEYYYADYTGAYPDEPTKVDATRVGTTDTTVSVTEDDKVPLPGYKYVVTVDTKESGLVAGDGSLVLKLYFARDQYAYKVVEHYEDANGNEKTEETTGKAAFEEAILELSGVEVLQNKEYDGHNYILTKVDGYDKLVSADVAENEVHIYYALDEIGEGDDPTKPDDIPDKYQTTVVFAAVNGTVDGATQVEKVVTLTDEEGNWSETGSYTLTDEDIPEAVAATGYAQSTKKWDAEPVGAVIDADENTKASFVVSFSPADQTYIVQYIDEDTNEGLKEQDTFDAKFGDYINGEDHATEFEGYTFTHATELWVTEDNQVNYVFVYYSKDENGDKIPDKYQTTVVFAAINGTVDGVTQVEKVVTLTDSEGNWSENGSYTLTEDDVPVAAAATGYEQETKSWDAEPVGAVIDADENTKASFIVSFSPADQTYIVQYIDEDTNEGLKEQDTFDAKFGDYIDGEDHAIEFEGYTFTHATELWVTEDNQVNYVFVYYSKDENGDKIPDKYQTTVVFAAINGTVDGVTQVEKVVTLTDSEGNWSENGSYTLTEDDVPVAAAATGYDQETKEWDAEPVNAVIDMKENTKVTFVVSFSPADQEYIVQYIDEDTNEGLKEQDTFDAKFGDYINGEDHATEFEGYTFTHATELWVTEDNQVNYVFVYYSKDENGDKIPDKYQTTVVFAAVNGTVDGATQVEKVVTLTDEEGNWSETGSYTLTEEDIPEAIAATGYAQSTKEWDVNPVGAVIDADENTKASFVVSFSPADQEYIVQYIDEDTNEGLKEQDTFGAKFGDYINGADHAIAFEGYAFTHATELWVTEDNQTNYVFVYYSKDEKGEDGPDDIPDKYQLVFTYQSADPNTGEVTGKTVEVYNFIDTPIEPTYPAANVTAAPAANYAFDYWVVEGKEDDPDYTRDMTFLKQTAYDTDTTFVAYFDTDEIGKEDPEKPDGVPDKYQIKFTYETEDSTHGTIDGASAAVEVVDRPRNSDGSYDMEKGVSPSVNVTVDALGRYRFENWTDEAGNTYSTSQLQAATFTADATFTAHFRYVSGNGNGNGGGSSSGSGGNPYNPDAPGPGTVMIDDDNVPLAPLPQQEGESFVIDEDSVPLAPLPKTGQQSSRIPVTMLLTGIFLALASLTRRREEES